MKPNEITRLCEIIGSLSISQFNTQEEYRDVIKIIFYEFFELAQENIDAPDCEI